jgi:hypothetical protein
MRGVVVGAGLGVLAVKKGGPFVQNKIEPRVRAAMLKYVISHATGPTGQAPSAGG